MNCNPTDDLKVDPDKLRVVKHEKEAEEAGNTLSDISSYTSDSSSKSASSHKNIGLRKLIEDERLDSNNSLSRTNSKSSNSTQFSSSSHINKFGSPNNESTSKTVKIREITDSMLQDRVVEVGVRPWKSESIKQFTNKLPPGPRLMEEKTKKRVIFPDNPPEHRHLYENIDDCRERGVEHPRKILPIPGRRLPFRQPPRVPVLSVHKHESLTKPEDLQDVDPEISFVSYRFYNKDMQEQNSLSQRCSAQLLRKSAMRLSLPRTRSKSNSVSL